MAAHDEPFCTGFERVRGWLLAGLLALKVLCLSSAAAPDPFASTADQEWHLQGYAEAAGLSHQRVFDIEFSPDGGVWLAAGDGLYQYDGYHWTRRGRAEGLPSDYVRSLCLTKAGELWVGTTAGAGVYHPREGRFDSRGTETWLPNTNVRAIHESADGRLWFCCDQWPDTSVRAGGIGVLNTDGSHRSYTQADGLPMNYLNGHYRDQAGTEWAFTPQGWVLLEGDRWVRPEGPVATKEPLVHEMAEDGRGSLVALGESLSLVRQEGRWSPLGERLSALCTTRQGDVFALERDREDGWIWFSRWDGRGFTACSAKLPTHTQFRYYKMKEAPDGSIWVVGYGSVIRWQRKGGALEYFPKLPRPQLTDAQGRTWFSGAGLVAWHDQQGFHVLPSLGKFYGVDADGMILGEDVVTGMPAVAGTATPLQAEPLGLDLRRMPRACNDRRGVLWVAGLDQNDRWLVACRKEGGLLRVPFPEAGISRIYNMNPSEDGGVTLCLFVAGDISYRLARVSEQGEFSWVDLGAKPPPLPYPNYVRAGGREWVSGHTSFYVRPGDGQGPWTRLFEGRAWGFQQVLTGSREAAVIFQGGPGVEAGCLVYSDGRWSEHYGDYYQASFGTEEERLYLIGPRGVHLHRRGEQHGFSFVPLPGDALPQAFAEGFDRSLWVGFPAGVIRVTPLTHSPVALVDSPVASVEQGGVLPLSLKGIHYMDTKGDARPFRYALSVDGAAPGPFVAGGQRSLSLAGLAPGARELQVHVEDAYGNRSLRPAVLHFTIRPRPIQERAWFYPTAIALVAVIFILLLVGAARTRQIALANAALRRENSHRRRVEQDLEAARGELERKVEERTAELVEANVALRNEIRERREAERSKLQLEEQLRQSQKMQAIGTLAGGIAHDFNNILAIILPNLHLALEERPGDPDLHEYLHPARQAAERARNLVKQILTFSRQEKQSRQVIQLRACVEEVCGMMRSTLPTGTTLALHIEEGVPPVRADSTQMHQVLMNLCTNSLHAFGPGGGHLELKLFSRHLSKEEAAGLHGLKAGPHVVISVEDNGCGMPESLQARIFEPFFTTKAPGRGTGLGLSVVHGIVREHEGTIRLWSQEGTGTRFEVYLPAASLPEQAAVEAVRVIDLQEGDGKRVLVVDDEPQVLRVVSRILERHGYLVEGHADPVAALGCLREKPEVFDLVITDLSMPGLTGLDLGRAIGELDPKLPVLLMSGYGNRHDPALFEQCGVRAVLQKPLDRVQLLEVVQAWTRRRPVI